MTVPARMTVDTKVGSSCYLFFANTWIFKLLMKSAYTSAGGGVWHLKKSMIECPLDTFSEFSKYSDLRWS